MSESKILCTRDKVYKMLDDNPSLVNDDKQALRTFYEMQYIYSLESILYSTKDNIFTVNRSLRKYRQEHPELKIKHNVQQARDEEESACRFVEGR